MKVEITKLNHNGEGMSHIDGKIVFVPKTIPGDVVELTNLREHKNFIQADIKKIIKESPKRIPIECPFYQECGGCHLMGLFYSEQLEYKKDKVKNILKKYTHLDVNPMIKESEFYHYRNKITLQVQNGRIGLFSTNSNKLIPIDNCLLISSNMNHMIDILKKINLKEVTQIVIREVQEQIMVQVIGQTEEQILIETLKSKVSSLYLNDKYLYGSRYIIDKLGKYEFQISPYSFFQINHNQTINLYNQIKTYLGSNNKNVLDLYCGTGSIGIYVSDSCQNITGIELNPSSVKDANQNIKRNHLTNIKIYQGDVGTVLKAKNTYDVIIVDPPRSGLDKRTRKTLLQIKSQKIIYISCNPITLARDLNDLQELYDLKEISLFDKFPNTYHVETICVMKRK